jgi:hypothetical protein
MKPRCPILGWNLTCPGEMVLEMVRSQTTQ